MTCQPATKRAAIAAILLILIPPTAAAPPPVAPQTALAAASAKEVLDRAEILQSLGRFAEAEQILSAFAEKNGREIPKNLLARIHNDLGSLCLDQRRFDEASRFYRQSIAEWENAGAQFRLHGSSTMNNLATALWADGRLSEARKTLARSAAVQIEVAGPLSPSLMQVYYNHGILSMALNNLVEAEEAYIRFLSIPNPKAELDHQLQRTVVATNLGLIYRRNGHSAKAQDHFDQGRRLWSNWRKESAGRPGPSLSDSSRLDTVLLFNVAESFWNAGLFNEAEASCDLVLSILEAGGGGAHPRLLAALTLKAQVLRKLKRKTDARDAERRYKQLLRSKEMGPDPSQHRVDALTLKSLRVSR